METSKTQNGDLGFRLSVYKHCFDSKHHYDNLSWVIGGIILIFVGALFAYIPQVDSPNYLFQVAKRLAIALFSLALLYLWHAVYERNRLWAEVANEKIKDFEREFKKEGVGLAFMKAHIYGEFTLKNTDENGV